MYYEFTSSCVQLVIFTDVIEQFECVDVIISSRCQTTPTMPHPQWNYIYHIDCNYIICILEMKFGNRQMMCSAYSDNINVLEIP
jgi:hypothetical protein